MAPMPDEAPVTSAKAAVAGFDAALFVESSYGRSAHRIEGHVVTQRGEKKVHPTPRVRARRTGLSAKHYFVL
jgi:hypothetical protein